MGAREEVPSMLGPSSAKGGEGSPGSCPGYPTHCVTAVSGQLVLKVRVTPAHYCKIGF